jgi:hypothetical protein
MTLNLPTTAAAILAQLDRFPYANGDPYALSQLMEFDSPITVHEDGTVTDAGAGIYAPSLWDDQLDSDRWELLDGYSGQYGYGGPAMHPSEFIGGRMARDILAEPGTYVAIVADYSPACLVCGGDVMESGEGEWVHADHTPTGTRQADADHEPDVSDDTAGGWAVARLIAPPA